MFSAYASPETMCATINFCHVEKKTWGKKDWSTDYAKDLAIPSLCQFDRPVLQVEPELGIELWVFDGDKKSNDWLKSQSHVVANLYTYKLTHVVATGAVPLSSSGFSFSHRLTPKGKSVVQVSCYKK